MNNEILPRHVFKISKRKLYLDSYKIAVAGLVDAYLFLALN